jgi:hypothetical protein
MYVVYIPKKRVIGFVFFALAIFLGFQWFWKISHSCVTEESLLSKEEVLHLVGGIFHLRNQAIVQENIPGLASLYDRSTRYGVYAYEHQMRKMKYLHHWCDKQRAKLSVIKSLIEIRRVKPHEDGLRITLLASTEYHYTYLKKPAQTNLMRIGTYHSLDLIQKDDQWQIVREWYSDPFADALATENREAVAVWPPRNRVGNQLSPRRLKAVAYADLYCGAAANDEVGFKYNKKYMNYNYSGGDCANFASQVQHEGGGFCMTGEWRYGKGGSQAWVNAQSFNQFMVGSGRASRLAYGSYQTVWKTSFQLLPGDYIAYERNGRVIHISVVTSADSLGYVLTNSHNVDRYRVPWDLGYGDRRIRFWLMRVNYEQPG